MHQISFPLILPFSLLHVQGVLLTTTTAAAASAAAAATAAAITCS
jgi:hypothetical protein